MKIESFNKTNLKYVREQIQNKLNELKELGLTIELGSISFNESSFTSKVTCSLSDHGDKYSIEFDRRHMMYGMSKEHLGKTFLLNGNKCKFLGFKPGARVNVALFEDLVKCSKYVTSVEQILKYMK
jgi:hypothetical protein